MSAYKLTEKAIGSTPTENTHFIVTQPENVNSEMVESVRRLTAGQVSELLLANLGGLKIFNSTIVVSSESEQTKEFLISDGFNGLVIAIGPTSGCGIFCVMRTGDRMDFAQCYKSGTAITVTTLAQDHKLRIKAGKALSPPINVHVLTFAGDIEEVS